MNADTYGRKSPSGQSHDYDQRMAVASSSSASSSRLEGDDMAHIPGSADCLCSACHLSRDVFPRRQDGKIELPNPILVASHKFGGRHRSVRATAHTMSQTDPMRLRIDAELREPNPRGFSQLSGPGVPANLPESQLSFPPSIRTFKMSADLVLLLMPNLEADLVKTERSQTPVPERHTAKDRARQSKKASSQPKSRAGRHTSWPDPYENAVEETFPQLFDSRVGLGIRGLNQSESSTSSRAISNSSGPDGISGQMSKSSSAISHGNERKTQSSPSPRNVHFPGRYDQTTSSLPASERPSTPREINSIEDPLRVIRFNSCQNPQPSTCVPRNNVGEVVQGRSQIRLSPEQIPTGTLRFQDPLMPESFPTSVAKSRESSTSFQLRWDSDEEKKEEEQPVFRQSTYPSTSTVPRDASVVQVKWDSERKRRQGYFSQEGVEKSPFRHYNKSSDFDPNP
ncbi:hypothetical protein JR316_0009600 [Psilocybe cubensis]|uniref:Uncharacterized protein n=1 Tax=Psilocybe cubensis TaxID=181762 RepID=A0ACB8GPJ3_PSICU|nr:hypothetical protein JR316_0009600 [Psilocybe cubensis]KAH9477389.1 hypothetical protein JR316_0009600 [Psilocybe cubensis]